MLTKKQVMEEFGCDKADAQEILLIQSAGFTHGCDGVTLDADDFEDAVGLDIEHVSTLMMVDEDAVRAVYDAGLLAGKKKRESHKKKAA